MFTVLSANKKWNKMTIYVDGEGWWYHNDIWFKVYPRIKLPKSMSLKKIKSHIYLKFLKACLKDGPMKEVQKAMEY